MSSSVAVRIWTQQQLAWFPHTDVTGDAWQFIKKGTCTSAGASGGTTLIDTNGDSSGADAYNGLYWVRILSGTQTGEMRRVIDDSGAGTLTFENNGFSGQIASGVEYEIWKSPEPVIVVDSSSGETDCVDAVRTDVANDFWKDFYVIPITGTHRGKIAKITGSTASTGTFVLASSFGTALTAGDVCLLRKFVEVSEPAWGGSEDFVDRLMSRVNFAEGDGVLGPKGGTFGFNAQVTASGSLSAASSKAASNAVGGLLEACGMEEVIDTSSTVGAGSSTTAVKISTGSWENHTVGGGVIWNGNFRRITSLEDGGGSVDTVNVEPALPGTPAAADVLYAVRLYRKSTDGDMRAIGLEWEVDGVRTTITGCRGNVTLQDGPVLTLAFNFNIDHYVRQVEAAPYNAATAYTTSAAVKSFDRIAYLDSTQVDIGGFTCSANTVTTPKNVQGAYGLNGRSGYHVTGYKCGGTFRKLLSNASEAMDEELRWTVRTAKKLLVIYGSHGNSFAVSAPVTRLVGAPHPANEGGVAAIPNVWRAQDAGTATDGASALQKVPDFAFFIS
jgi:hypothetical protein